MSGVEKFTALSDTIFKGRATDALTAVEAHDVKNSVEAINSFKSKGTEGIKMVNKIISDAKSFTVQDAMKYIDLNDGTVKTKKLMEDALNGMGKYGGMLANSSDNEMIKKVGELIDFTRLEGGELVRQAEILVDDVKYVFDGDNFKDASSFTRYLQNILGNDKVIQFIDLTEEAAFLSGLVSYAVELGLPELIDSLVEQSANEEVKAEVWSRVAADALYSSDLLTFKRVYPKTNLSEIRRWVSNPVRSLMMGFTRRTREYNFDRMAEANTLVEVLDILDPDWNKKNVGGAVRINLAAYQSMSWDAKDTLALLDDHRAFAVCGDRVGMRSIQQILTTLYPNIVITRD